MAHAGLPVAWSHVLGVRPGQRQIWFAAAAGALLIIAGLHLLPDAWADARAAGIWPVLVPMAAVAVFAAAGLAARGGCGCQEHRERATGAGTAAALTVHRFLEGAAIALAGSAVVALALAAHAFGEGLATGALGRHPRRAGPGGPALEFAVGTGRVAFPPSAGGDRRATVLTVAAHGRAVVRQGGRRWHPGDHRRHATAGAGACAAARSAAWPILREILSLLRAFRKS